MVPVPDAPSAPVGAVGAVDVVVVGAGPAGSAAAITAAGAGAQVVVVDRAAVGRDKCCGDGLTTAALDELEGLGLDPSTVRSWTVVDDVVVVAPSGRRIELPLTGSRARSVVAQRADLDAALVGLAVRAGAEVREGCRVTSVRSHSRGVTVGVRSPTGPVALEAAHVVAADGMWSPVRRLVGAAPEGYRGEMHALRRYARSEATGARRQWVWFEPDLLPGYAWSFPLPHGQVNLGVVTRRRGRLDGNAMARAMEGLAERPAVRAALGDLRDLGPVRAWPIPAGVRATQLHHGRVLFAGDAARAPDPVTGEGIAQALRTGVLAAESILAGGRPVEIAERYRRGVLRSLAADHRVAQWCVGALDGRRRAELGLRIVDANDWTRRHVTRWMFEEIPRGVLLTPRRWPRALASTPPRGRAAPRSERAPV